MFIQRRANSAAHATPSASTVVVDDDSTLFNVIYAVVVIVSTRTQRPLKHDSPSRHLPVRHLQRSVAGKQSLVVVVVVIDGVDDNVVVELVSAFVAVVVVDIDDVHEVAVVFVVVPCSVAPVVDAVDGDVGGAV